MRGRNQKEKDEKLRRMESKTKKGDSRETRNDFEKRFQHG